MVKTQLVRVEIHQWRTTWKINKRNTHMLATQIGFKLTEVRKNGTCDWVRPDGKTQVTCENKLVDGFPVPQRVHIVVISTQHY